MKVYKTLVTATIVCLSIISCNKDDLNGDTIEITGTIQKQGVTTHQYGTHTIKDYAISSSSVTLDNYINQKVTIIGQKVDGYPMEDGPEYITVKKIK
jgi:hypothetical protein